MRQVDLENRSQLKKMAVTFGFLTMLNILDASLALPHLSSSIKKTLRENRKWLAQEEDRLRR